MPWSPTCWRDAALERYVGEILKERKQTIWLFMCLKLIVMWAGFFIESQLSTEIFIPVQTGWWSILWRSNFWAMVCKTCVPTTVLCQASIKLIWPCVVDIVRKPDVSSGVIFNEPVPQFITSEFDSHWILHICGRVPKLSYAYYFWNLGMW